MPKVRILENVNWRPRFMDTRQDIIETENVSELASRMLPNIPLTDGQWTYYMTRTKAWVYRILTVEYNADGKWSSRRVRIGKEEGNGRRSLMQQFNKNLADKNKQPKLFEVLS